MKLLYSLIVLIVVTTFATCRPSKKVDQGKNKKMEKDGESAMEDIEIIDKEVYQEQDLVWIDIRLTDHQKNLLKQDKKNRNRRDTIGKNGEVAYWLKIWEKKVIHYKFDIQFSSETYRKVVRDAIQDLQDKISSCIQFIELSSSDRSINDYILIQNNPGCWSNIGYVGGIQVLNLNYSPTSARCAKPHIVQHEMLHSLGFYHEQSRPDRDQYIIINYDNIMAGTEGNFAIAQGSQTLGVKYDTRSIMHYSSTAFTINGQNTISRKGNPSETLGGKFLTGLDIMQIKMLYSCNAQTTTTKPTTTTTRTTTTKPTTTTTTTTKPTTTSTTTTKPTTKSTTTTTPTTTSTTTTTPTTTSTTTTTPTTTSTTTTSPTTTSTTTTTPTTTTTTTTTPTTTSTTTTTPTTTSTTTTTPTTTSTTTTKPTTTSTTTTKPTTTSTTTTRKVIIIVDPKTTTTTTTTTAGSNQCQHIIPDCSNFYDAVSIRILNYYCTFPVFQDHCPRTCQLTRCVLG